MYAPRAMRRGLIAFGLAGALSLATPALAGQPDRTVVATSDLSCRGMTAWEFKPFVEEHPDVAWALLQTLVGRLREAESV